MSSPPAPAEPCSVLAVSSNKGGVGKTTLASNLAIYFRALREDLPVLVVGLDDQRTLDRMFELHEPRVSDGNLKHAWAERSLTRTIQLGQYGVHFVPSPPDVASLKARAEDPRTLARILENTDWEGVVILDTKSDLEALTRNAYHAAHRILVPIADAASLEEAAKIFQLLDRGGVGHERARIVFTLVDRRSRAGSGDGHLYQRLREEAHRRGWPHYRTALSRSPRVETLNSGTGKPLSILHHARGTAVHAQMRELALEILRDLGLSDRMEALDDLGTDAIDDAEESPDELWGAPADAQPGRVAEVRSLRSPWRRQTADGRITEDR